jgi:splicing factor 45
MQSNIPPPPTSETVSVPLPPPPPPPAGVIARAPVRYSLPEAPAEIPASEAELEEVLLKEQEAEANDPMEVDDNAPRTNRPGQKGFAERLLAKYGWTKGSGLGASGTGITTALKVKVDKSKNVSAARGKIIGGKRKDGEDVGKFGPMSEVIVLQGMVDGLDLDTEMGADGTLVQEIGEECGEKVCSCVPSTLLLLT